MLCCKDISISSIRRSSANSFCTLDMKILKRTTQTPHNRQPSNRYPPNLSPCSRFHARSSTPKTLRASVAPFPPCLCAAGTLTTNNSAVTAISSPTRNSNRKPNISDIGYNREGQSSFTPFHHHLTIQTGTPLQPSCSHDDNRSSRRACKEGIHALHHPMKELLAYLKGRLWLFEEY